jgi:toxin FitB
VSYLLDTNVISEVRKGKRCDSAVARWWSQVDDEEIFFSVLTIGEIRKGIEIIRRRDADSAASLESWLYRLLGDYSSRVLPIDVVIADEWARLNVPDPLPVIDGLIAATARIRGLILVTRNTQHLERTGARLLNPFSDPSPPRRR